MSDGFYSTDEVVSLRQPVPAKWRVHLLSGVEYLPAGDKPIPNAFHRLMQRLAFGIRWERIKE